MFILLLQINICHRGCLQLLLLWLYLWHLKPDREALPQVELVEAD